MRRIDWAADMAVPNLTKSQLRIREKGREWRTLEDVGALGEAEQRRVERKVVRLEPAFLALLPRPQRHRVPIQLHIILCA